MKEKKEDISSQEMLKTDRYLWIARAFSAVAILATVANVILFSAIGSLYPLIRVQPFYLNVLDKNHQTIQINPIKSSEVQSKMILEALVRQYVLSRFEIGTDIKEVEERFGPNGIVSLMSTESVYKEFLVFYQKKGGWQERMHDEGLTVSAFIETADEVKNKYTWRVNLRLKLMTTHSKEEQEVHALVEMRVRYNPLRRNTSWQDRLKNPLGFEVTYFAHQEKK